jgi:DNA-binding Lrp family transcriptional regulator
LTRAKIEIDPEILLDLQEMGLTQKQASNELGICPQTLSKRMAEIQSKQGLLLQYRSLQSLQLTELQARILEAITPEKIEQAGLKDLVLAFKILKDKEQVIEGKPSEIKGLVSYLIKIEEEEMALKEPILEGDITEIKEVTKEITDPDFLPNLGD